jgi:hypothetical protein
MALVNVFYRVHCVESERGWGQDYFHVDFDTLEQADAYYRETNAKNTTAAAPDWYIKANRIEMIEKTC